METHLSVFGILWWRSIILHMKLVKIASSYNAVLKFDSRCSSLLWLWHMVQQAGPITVTGSPDTRWWRWCSIGSEVTKTSRSHITSLRRNISRNSPKVILGHQGTYYKIIWLCSLKPLSSLSSERVICTCYSVPSYCELCDLDYDVY